MDPNANPARNHRRTAEEASESETLIGWYQLRDRGMPSANCVLTALEHIATGKVAYRVHRQSFSTRVGHPLVRNTERTFDSIESVAAAHGWQNDQRVHNALEESWLTLCEHEEPSFAPVAVKDYWFQHAWERFLQREPTWVTSGGSHVRHPRQTDVYASIDDALEGLREKVRDHWDATVVVTEPDPRTCSFDHTLEDWVVSGEHNGRPWTRELVILTDGHEVFARAAAEIRAISEQG